MEKTTLSPVNLLFAVCQIKCTNGFRDYKSLKILHKGQLYLHIPRGFLGKELNNPATSGCLLSVASGCSVYFSSLSIRFSNLSLVRMKRKQRKHERIKSTSY